MIWLRGTTVFARARIPKISSLPSTGYTPESNLKNWCVKNNSTMFFHPAGPTVKVVSDLVRQLKTIDFLSTSWLRFNAFVFGLLK